MKLTQKQFAFYFLLIFSDWKKFCFIHLNAFSLRTIEIWLKRNWWTYGAIFHKFSHKIVTFSTVNLFFFFVWWTANFICNHNLWRVSLKEISIVRRTWPSCHIFPYKTFRDLSAGFYIYLQTKSTKKEEKQKLPVVGLNIFGFVKTKSVRDLRRNYKHGSSWINFSFFWSQ